MGSAVDAQGLSKRYRNGVLALDGVDLSIDRGQSFGLIGENGAGKSTFVGLVMGFIYPSSGSIRTGLPSIVIAPESGR